jgi:hypothetical protein
MIESIRRRIVVVCKWIYAGMLVSGIIYIAWCAIDKSPVYVIHHISSDKKAYAPGDTAELSVDLEKLRDCTGVVSKTLYGACGLQSTFKEPTTLPVGRFIVKQIIQIPKDAYYFAICTARVSIEYACNPWEQMFPKTFYFPVIKFEIRSS